MLTQREIKKSEAETLRIFRDFCEENHLKYYLAFGTLLGAVRHKGFIPWDDDVDVLMPRKDYEYLLEHFNDADRNLRKVVSKRSDPDFYLDSAKIIDGNTVALENDRTFPIGIWIDVFPMDLMPANFLKRKWTTFCIYWLRLFTAYSTVAYRSGRAWYRNLMVPLWRLICPSKSRLEKLHGKIIAELERNTSGRYYGILYKWYEDLSVPLAPVSWFEPSVKLEFEGEQYDAPAEYDALLRGSYGDYTTLPPPDLQKSSHSYVCYWKNDKQEELK